MIAGNLLLSGSLLLVPRSLVVLRYGEWVVLGVGDVLAGVAVGALQ